MDYQCQIAIVGAGSVGVSFLAQLIQHLETGSPSFNCTITVFEPAEKIGYGTAYQEDLNTNLLNIPAGNMSLYDKRRAHFLEWIADLPTNILEFYGVKEIDASAFYPRPLFGHYVQDQFKNIVKQAERLGIDVKLIKTGIVNIQKICNETLLLTDTDNQTHSFSKVILCNGNLTSDKFESLIPHKGYFHNPYPVNSLAQTIPSESTVGILGSNLSAIDVIVALKAQGHSGKIHCFSRQGILPAVRSTHPTKWENKPSKDDIHALAESKGGKLELQDVISFLQEKISTLDPQFNLNDAIGNGQAAHQRLEDELKIALNRPRPWQAVLSGMNEVVELVWKYLSSEGRKEFQTRWRSLWMSRRGMFPVQNALTLNQMFHSQQLHIHGGFQECTLQPSNEGFILQHSNASGHNISTSCDFVINATGFSQNVKQSHDPLVLNLLASGLAEHSEYGGFKLDFDTGALINQDQCIEKAITVLGSLACGTYFWTVSMDVNARLANEQAKRIAEEICKEVDLA